MPGTMRAATRTATRGSAFSKMAATSPSDNQLHLRMSVSGKAGIANLSHHVRSTSKSRHIQRTGACPLYPRKRHQMRFDGMSALGQKRTLLVSLLNNFVSSSYQRSRQSDAESFCSRQVYDQFDFRRLLDGEFSRLLSPQDSPGIYTGLTEGLC